MRRIWKIALVSLGVLSWIVVVLWYPYTVGSVPEWRLQIVDIKGHLMVGAQVNQEWSNPIDDGRTSSDSRNADSNGMVVFPRRVLHNRLALGLPRSAHVSVCWQHQYGDAVWDDGHRRPVVQLVLKPGRCPYG